MKDEMKTTRFKKNLDFGVHELHRFSTELFADLEKTEKSSLEGLGSVLVHLHIELYILCKLYLTVFVFVT